MKCKHAGVQRQFQKPSAPANPMREVQKKVDLRCGRRLGTLVAFFAAARRAFGWCWAHAFRIWRRRPLSGIRPGRALGQQRAFNDYRLYELRRSTVGLPFPGRTARGPPYRRRTILVRRVGTRAYVSIGTYVRLLAPELKQIDVAYDTVRLGAGATMSRIAEIPTLAFLAPAAKSIGRSRPYARRRQSGATFSRTVPTAISPWRCLPLDAIVAIQSPEGVRELDLQTFFKSRGQLGSGWRHRHCGELSAAPARGFLLRQSQPR